jgi:hypothetical protein
MVNEDGAAAVFVRVGFDTEHMIRLAGLHLTAKVDFGLHNISGLTLNAHRAD